MSEPEPETEKQNQAHSGNEDDEIDDRVYRLMKKAISEELGKRSQNDVAPVENEPGPSWYHNPYERYDNEWHDGSYDYPEDEATESEISAPPVSNESNETENWLTDEDSDDEDPPIEDVKIQEYLDRKLSKRESKEKLKAKQSRHKRPRNLIYGREVRVNTEIFGKLRKGTKIRDQKMRRIHKLCLKAAIAGAKLAAACRKMQNESEPKAVKDWGKSIYDHTTDIITLAGQASYGINMARREFIKPELATEFRSLCGEEIAMSHNLFGEDLNKRLKEAEVANKIASKNYGGHFSRGRMRGRYSRFQPRGHYSYRGTPPRGRSSYRPNHYRRPMGRRPY